MICAKYSFLKARPQYAQPLTKLHGQPRGVLYSVISGEACRQRPSVWVFKSPRDIDPIPFTTVLSSEDAVEAKPPENHADDTRARMQSSA